MADSAVTTVDEAEARKRALTVNMEAIIADHVQDVGSLDGGALTRWAVRMPVFPQHQYAIKGKGVPPDDVPAEARRRYQNANGAEGAFRWGNEWSVNLRADGYDWLNRIGVVSFHTPDYVHDREGKWVPNPIHGHDYLYHREVGLSYAETGQMVMYVEDIEIDFKQAWQAERLRKLQVLIKPPKPQKNRRGNASDGNPFDEEAEAAPPPSVADHEALLVRDSNGVPLLGVNGELQFTLPIVLEAEAAERLLKLREYGGRQVKTIAQRRIMARATAVKTLWSGVSVEPPELFTRYVMVVGWRDKLTPDQRYEKAQAEAKQVFGAPIRSAPVQPVAPEELDSVDDDMVVEGVSREAPPAEPPKDVQAEARAGRIPGVSVGMPGEKLSVPGPCGVAPPEGDPFLTCRRALGHSKDGSPHESAWGVWPSVIR